MENSHIEKHLYCSIKFNDELKEICNSLFSNTEIKYFSYNRYYRNQKWIGFYTDPAPVRIALQNNLGPVFVNKTGIVLEPGIYFHNDVKELLGQGEQQESVDKFFAQEHNPRGFKIVNRGLLILKNGSDYDESFYFSLLDNEVPLPRLYYHQNINQIKNFCFYFLAKGKKFVSEAQKYQTGYDLPLSKSPNMLLEKNDKLMREPFSCLVKKFCISTPHGDQYLSLQELKVLRLLSFACTQNEIAQELSLRPKTIESYLENVKNKLGALSKKELSSYYQQIAFLVDDGLALP
ncbi:MAG: helix-turn-helix transcriptional regulator [Myxococcales bacterium]|nr:MAG: helix-turn-helix transcriptional regulator [Myxococcales bacterium]